MLQKLEVFRAILVCDSDVTGAARNFVTSMQPKYQIELFNTSELLVDITEHELVPKHVVLSDEDKQVLLKRYNLKESQLPRMLLADPISRYFGLHRGQVVKIIRPSETAGRYVTYRIVN
jgi:DNA-directed RNA polymerase I, II, and III subunit RPABC1